MGKIGNNLGNLLLSKIRDKTSNVYLACTVEDADFLAREILLKLENYCHNIGFACFWNERLSVFEIEDLKVAPILKKYQEPFAEKVQYLIIIKSTIFDTCVLRTNLLNLIQKIEPEKIFIVAPVIYKKVEEKFKDEFDENICSKFEFIYFADNKRANKYGHNNKNEYIPEIVKKRRSQIISKPGKYRVI